MDCRTAGTPFKTDPSVVLLAQHLGTVASWSHPNRAALRSVRRTELSELDRKSVLALLARRGMVCDEDAKRLFHPAARKALSDLGQYFALTSPDYDLRVNGGGIAVSGEVPLHPGWLYVEVSIGSLGGYEILCRTVRDRDEYCGGAISSGRSIPYSRWQRVRRALLLIEASSCRRGISMLLSPDLLDQGPGAGRERCFARRQRLRNPHAFGPCWP